MTRIKLIVCGLFILLAAANRLSAEPKQQPELAAHLKPFFECVSGQRDAFKLSADIQFLSGDKSHQVSVVINRVDAESFDLDVHHQDYWLKLIRRADRTAMILPNHKKVFIGNGAVSGSDILKPSGITARTVGAGTMLSVYLPVAAVSEPKLITSLLQSLLKIDYDASNRTYTVGDDIALQFQDDLQTFDLKHKDATCVIRLHEATSPLDLDAETTDLTIVKLDRGQLERYLARGLRRAFEVLLPSPILTHPSKVARDVPNGRLRWVDGHRVVSLWGTPEEVGRAHGLLLKKESERCIDSIVHMFAIVQTIEKGRWFEQDLRAAYERLETHIPDDHKAETRALADAIGWDRQMLQVVNVFPELFHCSGFALFDSATTDGKLYHGRVLDYMTTIGLQDSATTFVVAVDGKIPFVTVGYAGFIGSVSGMNNRGISLGEMGGRGEGKWDGVPMATLMRRAMEECDTLQQVKQLWRESPRTCEYFYVFADGKTNEAVGVAATPESIEFIEAGASHRILGPGIPDAVVLSADERLKTLRARVQQKHGSIDVDVAKWLMSRPVAMESNLHNVLFVPADGVLYVANAVHGKPAAEQPYVRLNVHELIQAIPGRDPVLAASAAESAK